MLESAELLGIAFAEEKDEKASNVETTSTNTVISFEDALYVNGQAWNLDVNNPLQSAQNAQIRIGNTNITSTYNTFENLITGLNVEVKKR